MADRQGMITGPQTVKHGGKKGNAEDTRLTRDSHTVAQQFGIMLPELLLLSRNFQQ